MEQGRGEGDKGPEGCQSKRSLPKRPCRKKLLVVKPSISALGANLLSGKLSDSIGLLSLSKINLSESRVSRERGGEESSAVLIRFSALCQVQAQAPFVPRKEAGICPEEPLCWSWPLCSHNSKREQKQSPPWGNGASAQSALKGKGG